MSTKTFKDEAVCDSCNGTGIYRGIAEKKDCGVVCHTCKGTGCKTIYIEYEPFVQRKPIKGIKRVFKDSCGYGHCAEDFVTEDNNLIEFSAGGCTYKEWLAGVNPKPVKDLYCPYRWSGQSLQDKKHPQNKSFYLAHCKGNIHVGEMIADCRRKTSKCWKLYEEAGGK